MQTTLTIGMALVVAMAWTPSLDAQRRGRSADDRSGSPRPEVTVDWSCVEQRIAWFGTLQPALRAAERTGRPILLVSGAPQCRSVPGVW